jgi:hypothetical protein
VRIRRRDAARKSRSAASGEPLFPQLIAASSMVTLKRG